MSNERGPRGPYARSAQVKRRIIDACIATLAKSGYNGLTMKEVASRAGMSQAGVMHHFPTKELLLEAVLALRDEQAIEYSATLPHEDWASALLAIIRFAHEPGIAAVMTQLLAEGIEETHPAHEYFANRYQVTTDRFAAAFQRLIDQGELPGTISARATASLLLAVLDGAKLQWLYAVPGFSFEDQIQAFLTLIGADPQSTDVSRASQKRTPDQPLHPSVGAPSPLRRSC